MTCGSSEVASSSLEVVSFIKDFAPSSCHDVYSRVNKKRGCAVNWNSHTYTFLFFSLFACIAAKNKRGGATCAFQYIYVNKVSV